MNGYSNETCMSHFQPVPSSKVNSPVRKPFVKELTYG